MSIPYLWLWWKLAGWLEITGIQTHSTMVAAGGGAPMMTARREGAGDNLESQTHIQAEKDLRAQSIFPLNTLTSKIFLSSHFPVEQTKHDGRKARPMVSINL